jgi:hypothetical protein
VSNAHRISLLCSVSRHVPPRRMHDASACMRRIHTRMLTCMRGAPIIHPYTCMQACIHACQWLRMLPIHPLHACTHARMHAAHARMHPRTHPSIHPFRTRAHAC